ncbi:hypothetical protein ACWT_4404 [Actinoplanes sp. SE50]|nr:MULTISPECIES: hypothetical protein [unclassified Actinoplanes]AEV85424.1 hypothetical protein ACPL_4533 [Actinoplanes sp. SE50/110]ATO83819.1 hypothetical protein ACWT_4404 [Actinoplanes sp. SE50]SLM01227.1 hypothetical protein ACSP50_4463 [Actinoplanes sp. SE50/110]
MTDDLDALQDLPAMEEEEAQAGTCRFTCASTTCKGTCPATCSVTGQ